MFEIIVDIQLIVLLCESSCELLVSKLHQKIKDLDLHVDSKEITNVYYRTIAFYLRCCLKLMIDFLSYNSSDNRVVRASASGTVDLLLIPSQAKPTALKLIFTASLLDAQH